MTRQDELAALRAKADEIRAVAPSLAAIVDQAIDEFAAGERETLTIEVTEAVVVEKFDGDYEPGMVPVEITEHVTTY